ncbi:16S rRNA (uracil(1498)-N(3))-methyltransferase [Psychrobacter sp. 2Y5]|uniref:16S rRNA (uracil(1498)-N(3))-methyltransferase n=1 Tax=unclassified Psychrobacter TaxID=196806 RepID=UPI003F482059
MRRFFYATNNNEYPKLSSVAIGQSLGLNEAITHHWCRVLRASIGDQGILFDGFGGEYQVQLQTISKKQATAVLLAYNDVDRTAPIITKIGLVMSRGERMDYAIQKSTELGVTAIQLLSSQHGEVTLKPAQVEKKLAHWQQIAIAACEQCGLNRPPLILAPLPIQQWLAQSAADNSVDAANMSVSSSSSAVSASISILSQDEYYQKLKCPADLRLQLSVPAADQPLMPVALREVLATQHPYLQLLIGPEGGLSVEECQQAAQVGFLPWQIGARVLRTETAPVVALSSLYALSQ